jgi:hypothetical protein
MLLVQRGTTLRGEADIFVEHMGKAHAGHDTIVRTQKHGGHGTRPAYR